MVLLSQISPCVSDVVYCLLQQHRLELLFGVVNELLQEALVNEFLLFICVNDAVDFFIDLRPIFLLHNVVLNYMIVIMIKDTFSIVFGLAWSQISVVSGNSFGNQSIMFRVLLIQHDKQQIKTRKQRVWEAYIFCGRQILLVFTIYRIGCGNH